MPMISASRISRGQQLGAGAGTAAEIDDPSRVQSDAREQVARRLGALLFEFEIEGRVPIAGRLSIGATTDSQLMLPFRSYAGIRPAPGRESIWRQNGANGLSSSDRSDRAKPGDLAQVFCRSELTRCAVVWSIVMDAQQHRHIYINRSCIVFILRDPPSSTAIQYSWRPSNVAMSATGGCRHRPFITRLGVASGAPTSSFDPLLIPLAGSGDCPSKACRHGRRSVPRRGSSRTPDRRGAARPDHESAAQTDCAARDPSSDIAICPKRRPVRSGPQGIEQCIADRIVLMARRAAPSGGRRGA